MVALGVGRVHWVLETEVKTVSYCIILYLSSILCFCDKTLMENNLEEKGFISAYSSRSPHKEKSRQSPEDRARWWCSQAEARGSL